MIRRRKPLQRGKPPKANPETTWAWERRSRKWIPHESERHRRERVTRNAVREEVLARDGGCRNGGRVPVRCGSPDPTRPPLEVHEVISRGRWAGGYLEPGNCLALCQACHDWVTAHPIEAEEMGLSAKAPQPGLTKLPRPS